MISVSHLTKRYRAFTAVDEISFEVGQGEVVGFLGPNGAGKTTTMRMLAGYLVPTGGEARVAGYDVRTESLEVRRRIGYLPETIPLYPEMRVDEYLRHRARLKRVPSRRLSQMVAEVKERCGLLAMGKEVIGRLSRGYRQRVGLADALVHDPDLLLLDEPTLGLDPEQNKQVRDLIQSLADRHTILMCTHILPEVEQTCQRVVIIKGGKIIAADTPEQLRNRLGGGNRIRAEIRGPAAEIERALNQLPHVERSAIRTLHANWVECRLDVSHEVDLRTNLYELSVSRGWPLRELHLFSRSLEEVYLRLTGDRVSRPGVEKQP